MGAKQGSNAVHNYQDGTADNKPVASHVLNTKNSDAKATAAFAAGDRQNQNNRTHNNEQKTTPIVNGNTPGLSAMPTGTDPSSAKGSDGQPKTNSPAAKTVVNNHKNTNRTANTRVPASSKATATRATNKQKNSNKTTDTHVLAASSSNVSAVGDNSLPGEQHTLQPGDATPGMADNKESDHAVNGAAPAAAHDNPATLQNSDSKTTPGAKHTALAGTNTKSSNKAGNAYASGLGNTRKKSIKDRAVPVAVNNHTAHTDKPGATAVPGNTQETQNKAGVNKKVAATATHGSKAQKAAKLNAKIAKRTSKTVHNTNTRIAANTTGSAHTSRATAARDNAVKTAIKAKPATAGLAAGGATANRALPKGAGNTAGVNKVAGNRRANARKGSPATLALNSRAATKSGVVTVNKTAAPKMRKAGTAMKTGPAVAAAPVAPAKTGAPGKSNAPGGSYTHAHAGPNVTGGTDNYGSGNDDETENTATMAGEKKDKMHMEKMKVITRKNIKNVSDAAGQIFDTISVTEFTKEFAVANVAGPAAMPKPSAARKAGFIGPPAYSSTSSNQILPANAAPASSGKSSVAKAALGSKPATTGSVKEMGDNTTGAEKLANLSQAFNDIKYKVSGAKFAPGLTGGVNGTFFGPSSFKGFQFGFAGNFIFGDTWSIMTELIYFQRINNNYSLNDDYYSSSNKQLNTDIYSFSTLHSFELPVSARYHVASFNFFAGVNFVYTFSINTDSVQGKPVAAPVQPAGIENTPKLNTNDFGARFGVGYLFGLSYQVAPSVMIDLRNVQTVWDNAKSSGSSFISGQLYKSPSLQLSIIYRLGGNKGKNKD